jgi:hypothetical protein
MADEKPKIKYGSLPTKLVLHFSGGKRLAVDLKISPEWTVYSTTPFSVLDFIEGFLTDCAERFVRDVMIEMRESWKEHDDRGEEGLIRAMFRSAGLR